MLFSLRTDGFSTTFKALFTSHHIHNGTPTKRQVSKRQVSKRPVSKRLKRQVYKTSGLQNVWLQKTSIYIFCTCGWWKSAGSVAAMFAGKVMAVFYSLFLRGFLPYITIIASNR
jgi:hypothetical protein